MISSIQNTDSTSTASQFFQSGGNTQTSSQQQLTTQEKQQLSELKQRDREVKAHEQAHKTAGGQYVRGVISYEYETGPDNKQYAVGGEVSIDTSPVHGDPEATIEKMKTVRRAALAPAEPSAQDRRVASDASRKQAEAQQELTSEQQSAVQEAMRQAFGVSQYQNSQTTNQASDNANTHSLNLIA